MTTYNKATDIPHHRLKAYARELRDTGTIANPPTFSNREETHKFSHAVMELRAELDR